MCSCSSSPCSCGNPTNINLDTSAQVNICCRRGDTFTLISNISDGSGTAIDLTAYTFKMEVREYDDGPIVIANSDITITGTALGVLTINISAADMLVDSGTDVWEIQATNTSSGRVESWMYGLFQITQDIVAN